MELDLALSLATARPPTPPSYVPSGWTIEQAKGLDMRLVGKLSKEENRLWVAGTCADSAQRDLKAGNQAAEPPSYIPAGWSTEQAISPTFDILSRLTLQELTRYMESRNEQRASGMRPTTISEPGPSSNTYQPPSPLVQALQREGCPTWGFVLVRTYYASDDRWQAFQEQLDTLCNAQLDEETGDGLQDIKDKLEFKMIEDPRLQDASMAEARKHFHIARAMEGVAAGLRLGILLLVNEDVVNSFVGERVQSLSEESPPYLLAVDVNEAPAGDTPAGYPGFFRVSMDALLSELYPKICMGLPARELWAMMGDEQAYWIGDSE
ncbi:hypothetical protein HD806DRAFT_508652 [Xylariaceae sp. AK1471]|nr:hypothetical protein HD806DRAFT_508652 [Xylariaceae sp. AK1471]